MRSYKYEDLYLNPPHDGKEFYNETEIYIDFYNFERRHQCLNRKTPAEMYFQNNPYFYQLNIRPYWLKNGAKIKVTSKQFLDKLVESFLAMRPYFNYMSGVLTTDKNGVPLYD